MDEDSAASRDVAGLVVLVGSCKALAIAVRTAGTGRRHTALTHRLQKPGNTAG